MDGHLELTEQEANTIFIILQGLPKFMAFVGITIPIIDGQKRS